MALQKLHSCTHIHKALSRINLNNIKRTYGNCESKMSLKSINFVILINKYLNYAISIHFFLMHCHIFIPVNFKKKNYAE